MYGRKRGLKIIKKSVITATICILKRSISVELQYAFVYNGGRKKKQFVMNQLNSQLND